MVSPLHIPGHGPFDREMRKATRDIHAVSDALVNGKLALDNSVWADGLLVFYEIFRYLEEAMNRLRDKPVSQLRIDGMERTAAFEEDLKHYLGEDWKASYTPRESVANYLRHLMVLEESDPDLLVAYVYHLYMGLLSGGQILRKKKQIMNRLPALAGSRRTRIGGDAVTNFGGRSIYQMKKDLMSALNSVAATLDEEKKKLILKESRTVFELNNTLVKSVKGVSQVVLRNLAFFLAFVFMLYMLFKLFMF